MNGQASLSSAESADVQLAVEGLKVVYESRRGPVPAVDDLTFTVKRKEFVAVLGPSGCGKSTLLRIVSGILSANAGTVTLDGTPITGPRPDVGIVFQQPVLLPWKTVLDNVLVPIRALRQPVKQYTDKAKELLRLVGLQDFVDHYPHELSGGMQQRVGIARGLIHDPSMLLMDEPFAALDAMTREQMSAELQSIWMETDKAVLFITHSIPEAVFLADRVLVFSERPARVVDNVEINLPRPRSPEIMADPAFTELCARLRTHFTQDTAKTRPVQD